MDVIERQCRQRRQATRPLAVPSLTAAEAFNAYWPELHRYLVRLTRDPEEAAELVQDAFCRLICEEQAGRSPDQVRAWLYRVATNLATSRARRRSVAARHAEEIGRPPTDWESPQDESVRRDDMRRVSAALANLTPDARTAMLLAAKGYGGQEIAERIGRSEAATRTLLCRSRARVRELLATADAAEQVRARLAVQVVRGSWAASVRT